MTDRHVISPYPVRMPPELREELERSAKKGARSLHAEIIARLERSIESDRVGLTRDALDTLGLQSILTLTLLDGLDTSKFTDSQLMAVDGLRQVSDRIATKMRLNKSGDKLIGLNDE